MQNPNTASSDLIWRVSNIAKVINRTKRQTHHLLTKGAIAAAQKKLGRWCASRSALLREFNATEAA